MKDPSELLWRLATEAQEKKSKALESGWKLKDKVDIFPNPSARCPSCETWIPTNRIWLVDEDRGYLLGCWKMDGSRVDWRMEIVHPHVYQPKGEVCLGESGGASNALFSCIAPGKHYYSTERWFESIGHDCPQVIKPPCDLCGTKHLEYESDLYGHNGPSLFRLCPDRTCWDVAVMFRCIKCFSQRDFYETKDLVRQREDHCESCYLDSTTPCGFCEGRVFKHRERLSDEKVVCEKCRFTHSAPCARCGKVFTHNLLTDLLRCYNCKRSDNSDPERCTCPNCRRNRGERQCSSCETWFDEDDLYDGVCESCREDERICCSHCGEGEVDAHGYWCDYCRENCLCECGDEKDEDYPLCRNCGPYRCRDCDNGVSGWNEYCPTCIEDQNICVVCEENPCDCEDEED